MPLTPIRFNDMETESLKKEIFNRTGRLLGNDALNALQECRVIVFGIGGVGSWAAEALVRTGVGHLTIVDADRVSPTNINRQVPATVDTVGIEKTEAMKSRLLAINPWADIVAMPMVYDESTAPGFDLSQYDYVIDAIDSLADKALLILSATRQRGVKLFSSMGAALKLDPTRVRVAEFWKVEGCPLGAALRRRFKKSGVFPSRKFKCVFSPELLSNRGEASADDPSMSFNKAVVNGSLCHITAIFGMTLAGLVIEDAVKRLSPVKP